MAHAELDERAQVAEAVARSHREARRACVVERSRPSGCAQGAAASVAEAATGGVGGP
jgi:hypothetical protein